MQLIIYWMAWETSAQPPASQLGGVLWEEWQNIPQGPDLKFLSVNAKAPSSMQMKPMTSISDRNHILTHPSLIFNFGSFVNKIMLKIKDHWTINIDDYIPEVIRSLDRRINSLYRKYL
jgi:hypothetical protein